MHSSAGDCSSSSPSISAIEQEALYNSRTLAYVTDPTASHIQHSHKSAEQSKASHTSSMKEYLDEFDTTMAMAAQK